MFFWATCDKPVWDGYTIKISDVCPRPWPWSVLKDLFKVCGLDLDLDNEVLGHVIKSSALGWPYQFVLEIVHQGDSQVLTVSVSGTVCMSLLLKD